jgi:hypothetical protein
MFAESTDMKSILGIAVLAFAAAALGSAQDKYTGPRPPKPDLPYLMHADNLEPTQAAEAKEEQVKNLVVYALAGPACAAKTPLAGPIFLIQTEKLDAAKLELYRMEVKDGRRQVAFSKKKPKDSARPIRLGVSRLEEGLFRIEVDESLEPGEYSLTPSGSNQVFCFQVY